MMKEKERNHMHMGHVNVMDPLCMAQNPRWITTSIWCSTLFSQCRTVHPYTSPHPWYPSASFRLGVSSECGDSFTSTLKNCGSAWGLPVSKCWMDGFSCCILAWLVWSYVCCRWHGLLYVASLLAFWWSSIYSFIYRSFFILNKASCMGLVWW
jgi:hypothetical protein